ncbi:MAG: phage portal protein [Micropepsaceae bacterium]
MGLLSFLGLERRSAPAPVADPYFALNAPWRGVGSASPDVVLSNLAVAARCVSLRSELLASVPLFLFRRSGNGGRERAADTPLYGVLHDLFNENMTAFEGREFLIRSLDVAGNGYARIERNARGEVTALYPYPPGVVSVERLQSGRLRYRVTEATGRVAVLLQEEMLHLRGASRDGIIGQSPLQIARGAVALAVSQAETAGSLMTNAMRPSGVLAFPEKLSPEARKAQREGLEAYYAGPANAGRLLITEGGAKFERLTFTPEDAEFLDSRKLSNEDVARVFGVPPTSVGITDKATYSNVEQESTMLVRNALGPLAARIEAAMLRDLLTPDVRADLYVEHDLAGLLRGDTAARYAAYRIGREWGWLSPNDIRRTENLPPIPDGDLYTSPLNQTPLGAPSME